MDIQKMVMDAVEAKRAREMLTSSQLTLGELVLKLEAVSNKKLSVVFDDGKYKPTGLGSWRGSYCELAIQYENGGDSCYELPEPSCKLGEFGEHLHDCPCGGRKEYDTSLPKKLKVEDLLKVLKIAMGKYFVGYKGGDFTMGKTTPIWVANYGSSSGFKSDEENGKYEQGVVDVVDAGKVVSLITEAMNY